MKKKSVEKIVDLIPNVLENAAGWLKNNFEENGKEILSNASGSVGSVFQPIYHPMTTTVKNNDDYSKSQPDDTKSEEKENSLLPIETLMQEYFGDNKDNIGKILFIT